MAIGAQRPWSLGLGFGLQSPLAHALALCVRVSGQLTGLWEGEPLLFYGPTTQHGCTTCLSGLGPSRGQGIKEAPGLASRLGQPATSLQLWLPPAPLLAGSSTKNSSGRDSSLGPEEGDESSEALSCTPALGPESVTQPAPSPATGGPRAQLPGCQCLTHLCCPELLPDVGCLACSCVGCLAHAHWRPGQDSVGIEPKGGCVGRA